ncbi:MAG: hypothetical protein HOM52_12005 [Rhodospirillaceae bacterium]|nr:hypothetical protein [Rhodospirillaceae bacterium]
MSEKKKSSGAKASKSKSSSDAKPAATETKSTKGSESAADKAADKSDSAADKSTDSSAENSSAEKSGEKSGESGGEKSSESGGGKSQKETMSSGDVHYGYFSSVRTPAYRKGWDDIFGKETKTNSAGKKKANGKTRNNKRARIKAPLALELDINELPEDLRAALDDEIRRQTKRRRINYDKLNAAGAVRWNINCEIKR